MRAVVSGRKKIFYVLQYILWFIFFFLLRYADRFLVTNLVHNVLQLLVASAYSGVRHAGFSNTSQIVHMICHSVSVDFDLGL